MSLAIIGTNKINNGVAKKEFADAFQELNSQVRLIEQKLVLKVEHEIMNHFHSRQNEIFYLKDMIKTKKKLKKQISDHILLFQLQ